MTGWRSTLQIAWRNLWRNPRRTGLALAAIGLSVTLVGVQIGAATPMPDHTSTWAPSTMS